jgi:archaellum component FlaF (FlaF/FlaG flagellin family)
MKKIISFLVCITLICSSCGIYNGLTTNTNAHTTDVILSKKNFKVIARVKGSAQETYVFGIGGLTRKALIEEARTNMFSNMDIIGSSKAIINETVEIKSSYYFIVETQEVTVSAHIIEFTE